MALFLVRREYRREYSHPRDSIGLFEAQTIEEARKAAAQLNADRSEPEAERRERWIELHLDEFEAASIGEMINL